jgi:pilus assembly protein CpaF
MAAPPVVPPVPGPRALDHPGLTREPGPGRFVPALVPGLIDHRGTEAPNGGQRLSDRSRGAPFGPLRDLIDEPGVTDVFVNGGGGTWVDRGSGLRPDGLVHLSDQAARALATRLVAAGGRHVDEASPCVDVRLEAGIRVHVVLPPVSTVGTLLSIRLPRRTPLTLDALSGQGFFDAVDEAEVRECVARRANLLITGAGGAGKTTFLAGLLAEADPSDRIVTIEDVAELRVDHPHVVALETRQPNLEGVGGVDLARLLREALRMRPDRLVVGECRGVEVRDLLSALNTGHDGGAGTLHANGLADVPARLEALGAVAGLSPEALARQAVSAFDAVFHLERTPEGRRLAQVGRLVLDGGGALIARPGLGRRGG